MLSTRLVKLKRLLKKIISSLSENKPLVAVVVIATLLRFVGLWPNTNNADEAYIQTKSWDMVHNFVKFGDVNPHTFKYGSIMFYLQALGAFPVLAATYLAEAINSMISSSFTAKILDFSLFYNEAIRKYGILLVAIGRAETALIGVLSVIVLYFIAKKLFNKRVGLISSLLFAIAPLHVRDSHYITTDILSVFTILVSLLCLTYLMETKKWKWFILSGISLGISATIRYFPLALLAYPIAIIFSFERKREWFLKVIISAFFVFVGVFLGVPYLFIDPNGPALLMEDMQKYVLPWYSTSISNYIFSIIMSFISHGKSALPDIKMLYSAPKTFRPVHASWLFFNGIGIFPTLFGLAGIALVLFKSIRKFLFLLIIPLVNFIYISQFIPVYYERLVIPLIPFMAIFAAVFIDFIFKFSKKHLKNQTANVVLATLIFLAVLLPFVKSASASLACSEKSIQNQSVEWVMKNNIPDSARIGYLTMVSVPPRNYAAWMTLEPTHKLSLEEAKKERLDYAFLNTQRLDYNTFDYFNSFFKAPDSLFENSYFSLIFSEYQSRATLLGKVQKPWMCDSSRIYYYKLPETIREGTKKILNFDFKGTSDLENWQVKNFDKTGNAEISLNDKIGKADKGSLEYKQTSFNFTSPRVVSSAIQIEGGKNYTFSFWAKGGPNIDKKFATIIGRLDFYDNKKNTLLEELEGAKLLADFGSTPLFFEKKRELGLEHSNTDLPGKVVALSIPAVLNEKWQRISVTTSIPKDVNFATLSIQTISGDSAIIYTDDVSFASN